MRHGCAARLDVLALGAEAADLDALVRTLYQRYSMRALRCEGGPRLYGAMLQAGLVDKEFLILSPLMVGEAPGIPRPSLVEGTAFAPEHAPRSTLVSLRRVGELTVTEQQDLAPLQQENGDGRALYHLTQAFAQLLRIARWNG